MTEVVSSRPEFVEPISRSPFVVPPAEEAAEKVGVDLLCRLKPTQDKRNKPPIGTTEAIYPALKRWAKLFRAYGAGFIGQRSSLCSTKILQI